MSDQVDRVVVEVVVIAAGVFEQDDEIVQKILGLPVSAGMQQQAKVRQPVPAVNAQ